MTTTTTVAAPLRWNGAELKTAWHAILLSLAGSFVGGVFFGIYSEQSGFVYRNGVLLHEEGPFGLFLIAMALIGFSSALFFVALVTLAIVWALDISRGR